MTNPETITALSEQINTTIRNLERGEVQKSDRIFLNHVLEEFQILATSSSFANTDHFGVAEFAFEMVGSSSELVEDGLN
jgi:hypothetical protein